MIALLPAADYPRRAYAYRRHHERYVRRVEAEGLVCQECSGKGGFAADVIDYYYIYESCGWCEGTGKVTRWLRGQWLRYKREEKE